MGKIELVLRLIEFILACAASISVILFGLIELLLKLAGTYIKSK